MGRVHEPSFRLVLTDSKNSTKSGRFKEILGTYDPRKSTNALNAERLQYWVSQGAGLTDTVHNLLVTNKVLNAPKINVSKKSKHPPAPPVEVVAGSPKEEPAPAEKTEDAIIEDVIPASTESSGEAMKEETVWLFL